MSLDKFSCCVVQKCLELEMNEYVETLIQIILDNAFSICSDEFGSFVVLKVIQTKSPEIQRLMIEKLFSNFSFVCSTKNSIQIIEKSLEFVKGKLLKDIINCLLYIDNVIQMTNNSSGLFSKF